MYSHSSHRFKIAAGFGLIELMVSISIMMLVAAIILIRQDSFNGAVLLESQAYEIALATREVQQNAVSASSINGTTRQMLGVYFDLNNRSTYRIFRENSQTVSHSAAEEYGQQNSIDPRFELKDLRVNCTSESSVSVMFERPNFDGKFYVGGTERLVESVEIDVGTKDPSAGVKTVIITSTGQISVGDSLCN